MPNFNDAEITSLYVSEPGSVKDIQDPAPNAPSGGKYRVALEMVAGDGVLGTYELITTCTDVTDTSSAPAQNPGAPLNGSGTFQSAPWKKDGTHWVFNESVTLPHPPGAGKGHIYKYSAAVHNSNGQIVSLKESEPFILL
jgi:hypothetical protein